MPSSIVLGAVFGDALLAAAALGTVGYAVASFAINMLVSSIITKAFAPSGPNTSDNQNNPNPGNRQQMPPATDNKLPVVYGSAYVGGIVTDLTISDDNQTMYYCLALSEVTGTESGAPDAITFGDIYWGGKKCVFDGTDTTKVVSLLDESTGESQTNVSGNLFIYTYSNGSYSPVNSTTNAVYVMSADGLTYKWDGNKLMSNCVFAIVKVIYNQDAGLTGLQQTKFQVINERSAPGDCFADYMTSERYGAAIPTSQIDYTSLTALNTYSSGSFTYTPAAGGTATQSRFRFDGTVDTQQTIMNCLQQMAASCDCLLRYNEVTATWGIIVQSPAYSVAMAVNDSNMVSAIQITPTDLANTPNIIETKFANSNEKDSFASAVFSLQQLAPSLLYPNEPINKQSVSLPLVNNDVRAQYIATRLLKAGREDLIVKVQINYSGLQLEAGDIISLTSTNYGWTDKLFRLSQIVQIVADDGQVTASLTLIEYNASVYDDAPITQFALAPNTGIPSPLAFGTVYAPTVVAQNKSAAAPYFTLAVTAASAGVSQYAEVWYSAYANPSASQRIFAGTTVVKASGNPYAPNESMGTVTVSDVPQGDWYFFARMVNSLGTSQFSPASDVLQWRPATIQFDQRYVLVAYADDQYGDGFSLYATNKSWFGLLNQDTTTPSSDPEAYTWYEADPVFGTGNFLLYINRGSRKFSFGTGDADYANTTGAFVPTDTSTYDPTLWSALATGDNHIDLDLRTGQLLTLGTSSVSPADGLINVTNTPQGLVVASLERFLNFGDGVKYKTSAVANLTIDIYGRVVGFSSPDVFNYTETVFNASGGQTVFTLAHTVGNIIIFRNGILLGSGDYTETSTNFTLGTACAAGEKIVVLNMAAETTDIYYEPLNISIASSTSTTITYASLPYQYIKAGDALCFSNVGTPTTFTVSAVNYATKTITFTGSISGATAGLSVYRYRAANTSYAPFSRYEVSVTNAAAYLPTQWAIRTGFEMVFLNGSAFTALDYNVTDGTINGLPNLATGTLTIYQFNENNLGTPCANPGNSLATTVTGVTEYAFAHDVDAFELYSNGAILARGYDFTDTSSLYTLAETPTNDYTVLHQQTFARVGAA